MRWVGHPRTRALSASPVSRTIGNEDVHGDLDQVLLNEKNGNGAPPRIRYREGRSGGDAGENATHVVVCRALCSAFLSTASRL